MKPRMVSIFLLVGTLLVLALPGAQPAARRLGRVGLTVAARSAPQLGAVNTWTMEGGPFSATSIALSPDFASDGRVFAASWWYRVFESSDSGDFWKLAGRLNNYGDVIRISPSFTVDSTLFVASGAYGSSKGAVHKSTDGGHTWTVKLYQGYVEDIEISPNYRSDRTIFAASRSGGLFKSSDAAESWVNVYGEDVWEIAVSPAYASDQTLFAISDYVVKSTDGGVSWTSASQGLMHEPALLAVSPDFAVDQTVFAGASYFTGSTPMVEVYKSADGGQNWVLASTISGREGPYALAISPDYAADHSLFLSAVDIYASHDSGASWVQKTDLGRSVRSATDIEISPGYATDSTIFANLADGVYRSTDRGTSWHTVVPGESVVSVAYAPPTHVYAAVVGDLTSNTGGVFRSADNGTTWSIAGRDVVAGVSSLAISPAYESDGTLFAGHYEASVSRSTDAGASWTTAQLEHGGSIASLALSPDYSVDKTVFAGLVYGDGGYGSIYRSTDGGWTWASVSSSLPQITGVWALGISPSFRHDRSIFAGTDVGLFRSVDGGESWALSGMTSATRSLAVSPSYATDGILFAGGSKGILKSVDRGQTWYTVLEDNLGPSFEEEWNSMAISPDFASNGILFAGRRSRPFTIWSQSAGECWDTLGSPSSLELLGVMSLTVNPLSGPTIFAGGYQSPHNSHGGVYQMTLDIDNVQPVGNLSTSWDVVPSMVPADGATAAVITVTLRDSSCSPVSGKWLTLWSDRGDADSITYVTNPTDGHGQATAIVTSSTAGTATVKGRLTYDYPLNGQAIVVFGEVRPSLAGTVTDGHGHPLGEVFVGLLKEADASYAMTTASTANGGYAFNDVPSGSTYRIDVILRDGSSKEQTLYGEDGLLVSAETPPFSFPQGVASLTKHIDFADPSLISHPIPVGRLDDLAAMYYHTRQTVDFVRGELGVTDLEPVTSVWGFAPNTGRGAYYSPAERSITIEEDISEWASVLNGYTRPTNREWHENFHHLMDMTIGMPPLAGGEYNHEGYDNPSTDDSWAEGWAEFWPCVLWGVLGYPNPHLYHWPAVPISFEQNWQVWDYQGPRSREEFAVASLLWDLYDSKSGVDSDSMDLSLDSLWSVIGTTTAENDLTDMRDVYNALWQADLHNEDGSPVSLSDIDQVFIAHGFYADGNGNHEWDPAEEVGWAGQPGRRNTPDVPNAVIRAHVVDPYGRPLPGSALTVNIKFGDTYYDYSYELDLEESTSDVPVEPPPAREPVMIELSAQYSVGTSDVYSIDNATYWDDVAASTSGYAEEITLVVNIHAARLPLAMKEHWPQ